MRNVLSEFLKKLVKLRIPSLQDYFFTSAARTGTVSTAPSSSGALGPKSPMMSATDNIKNGKDLVQVNANNVPQNVPSVVPFQLPKNVLFDSLTVSHAASNAER